MKKSFILISICLLSAISGFAQSSNKIVATQFWQVNQLLADEKISSEAYFDSVFQIATQAFVSGNAFERKEFLKLLIPFQKLCFENEKYKSYRSKYYTLLANNARFANRDGECLYYLDKIVQLEGSSDADKLRVLANKAQYFAQNGFYEKGASLYLENKKAIKNIQILDKYNLQNLSILYFLNSTSNCFAQLNDKENTLKTIREAQHFLKKIKEKIQLENVAIATFMVESMEYYYAELIEKDFRKGKTLIAQMEQNVQKDKNISESWRQILQDNIKSIKISYFLETHQNDSARKYILGYEDGSIMDPSIQIDHYEKLSRLYENEKNYAEAFKANKKANQLLDTLYRDLSIELNDLMYAFTDAEYSREKLTHAEKISKRRSTIIAIITLFFIVIIGIVIVYMKRKEKFAQERIDYLNTMAEFQIAEMEEIKNLAISQEQQKLGMDLHDGLASSVASIKNRIELILMDAPEDATKRNLKDIHQQVEQAYISVRNKSHLLYENGSRDVEMQFERRIKSFISNALPEPHFENEILIDESASENLPIDSQIEILKITQEAVANIIKHAKASKVSVLVYEEDGLLHYSIKDNGRGYKTEIIQNKKNSLGLNSIKKRAQDIGGKLNISSSENGTEISISIPLRTV